MAETTVESCRILGIRVTPVTVSELLDQIAATVERGERLVVGHHNLHSAWLYRQEPTMREFYARADVIYLDGMPMVSIGMMKGLDLGARHRITLLDWLGDLSTYLASNGLRGMIVGGEPDIAEIGVGIIRKDFPEIQLRTHHGYFDLEGRENEEVLAAIARWKPQILLVGMGMPRQERWIHENLDRIEANVVISIGATFDYLAGVKPIPPRWLGRVGLEWLFRLATEPRRLSRRYVIEPVMLLVALVREYSTGHRW